MKIDPKRMNVETGIPIRALDPRTERWGSFDIGQLDKPSLIEWLKNRDREYILDVLGIVLGHGHLRDV